MRKISRTVIVDIDETLVYSRKRFALSIDVPNPPENQFPGMENYTIMRPSAPEFLEILSKKYNIISVTRGIVGWQKAVLEKTGLDKYIKEVYGYLSPARHQAQVPDMEQVGKFVLVDNDPIYELGEKEQWLGTRLLDGVNYIQCQEYKGHSLKKVILHNEPCLGCYPDAVTLSSSDTYMEEDMYHVGPLWNPEPDPSFKEQPLTDLIPKIEAMLG